MLTDPAHPLVLAVDDDLDTRELYHLLLESVGYRVATAPDVRAAAATATDEAPSVVITDWRLPDGDGLNVLNAVYERHPTRRPPFVAISGFDLEDPVTAEARAKGFTNILVKPVLPDDLLRVVRRAIEVGTANRLRAAAERLHQQAIAAIRDRARTQDPAAPSDAAIVRRAVEQTRDDVAVMVADDRAHYVAAGGRTRELTGYAPEELLSMTVWDLTPPPAEMSGQTLWTSFIASGVQEGRYMLRRRDGVPVEAQYCAIANIVPGLHVSAIVEASQAAAAL